MTQVLEKNPIIDKHDFVRLLVLTDLELSKTSQDNFRMISSSRLRIHSQLTKKTENFPNEIIQELSPEMLSKIQILIEKITQYLTRQNINYKINQEVTSDPEYPDVCRVKIGIKISKDFDFISNNLKKPIYSIINESIPPEFEDKILIKLEKL